MNTRPSYTTDLSDTEWQIIEQLLPGPKDRGRKIKYDRREVLNAIFYLNRNGCHWRDLPHDFPPYRTVSHYYHQWRRAELWQTINDTLRTEVRLAQGRDPQPSAGCLDSQSFKTTEIASPRGYDAGKKINGIKRHILVETPRSAIDRGRACSLNSEPRWCQVGPGESTGPLYPFAKDLG